MLTPFWSVVLTVVFAVTGGYSLLRWARRRGAPQHAGESLVDLDHLVMGVVMVAMIWRPSGATVGTVVQIVVFALFAAAFVVLLVRRLVGHPAATGRRVGVATAGLAAHIATNLAMVWMLAVMPLTMGGARRRHGDGGHAGYGARHRRLGLIGVRTGLDDRRQLGRGGPDGRGGDLVVGPGDPGRPGPAAPVLSRRDGCRDGADARGERVSS